MFFAYKYRGDKDKWRERAEEGGKIEREKKTKNKKKK
jgi:hypothetical protein